MTVKTIRIPVIVDSRGKWAAYGGGYLEEAGSEPDWSIVDEMADYEEPLINPRRMWVIVDVPLPETLEIAARATIQDKPEGGE